MTVCVGVIANNGAIIGAADRMLTTRAMQHEPSTAKIYHFAVVPVTVMWAGSSAVFAEVIQAHTAEITRSPEKYQRVQAVVDLYCNCFSAFIGKRAERAVLGPLGLTRQDLVSSRVSNDRARSLVERVTEYALLVDETVQVIIAGHDPDGAAHIWSAENAVPWCHDIEGFAAIGIGADHADSQLRFAGYTRTADPQEAMIMAYLAKKRAEVAPGVGRTTDMCMRDGVTRSWTSIPTDWLTAFEGLHKRVMRSERASLAATVKGARAYLEQFRPPPAPVVPLATELPPPPESTDGQ